jgi:phosphoribosylamine--glycine ligase
VVTAGGRVLGVTALGGTLDEARTRAYAGVAAISWPGAQVRTDIARLAVEPDGDVPEAARAARAPRAGAGIAR